MHITAPITGRQGPKGVKAAVSTLLAACALLALGLAFGPGKATAASAGDPINAEFNYAGLNVDVTLAVVNELVLEDDGTPLEIAGTYTDSNGNFTLPKDGGLVFPQIAIDAGSGVDLEADIGLESDGTGNYNESTGVMSMDLAISLKIGVSDVSVLPIPGLGSGPLGCVFAPINIKFSTANGWPAAGSAFADPATIENGSLAGAWRSKPKATVVPGQGAQATCDLISGVLKDVGGLWIANSSTPILSMPAATQPKPNPETCEEHGKVGRFPLCEDPPIDCPEGQTGTPPNCEPIVVDPPPPPARCQVARVALTRAAVRAGKRARIRVTVRNNGRAACRGRVTLRSNRGTVRVPKAVAINVAPGRAVNRVITVSTTRRARGRATITARFGGKVGRSVVTVRPAARKRR